MDWQGKSQLEAVHFHARPRRLTQSSLAVVATFMVWLTGLVSVQSQELQTVTPAAGQVNQQASRVFVFVDKKGIGHQHGVEGSLSSGSLRLNQASDAGKLVFDMTSFDADTPRARAHFQLEGKTDDSTRGKVNANMRAYTLKPDRYPEATFVIKSSLPTDRKTSRGLPVYELMGDFTLCGRTRPLRVMVDAEMAKGWLHIRGSFNIKQTEYGITPYSMALGAIGVADTLKIDGDLFVAPDAQSDLSTIPERSQP